MTRRFIDGDQIERPAFLAGERSAFPDAPQSVWRRPKTPKMLSRHDWQVLLILVAAIAFILGYARGHRDGSHAEVVAHAMAMQMQAGE